MPASKFSTDYPKLFDSAYGMLAVEEIGIRNSESRLVLSAPSEQMSRGLVSY